MMRMLVAAGVIGIAFLVFIFVVEPRLSEAKLERLNKRLSLLRDRVAANPSDTNAFDRLVAAVHSNNSFERNAAIACLGQLGPRAEPAVGTLIAALNGPDPYDVREAARSLGNIGPGAKAALPALSQVVKKRSDADAGWFAADSLAVIAEPNDPQVISLLEEAQKSPDPRMVEHASRSLLKLQQRRLEKNRP